VEALDPSEPDEALKVNQVCVEVAVQLSVDPPGPVLLITIAWLLVDVAPCGAAYASEVKVVIERMGELESVAANNVVDVAEVLPTPS
jgi:hypothetical protein